MCGVALTGAPGYVDEGALCREEGSIITYAKKSYGRGAGQLLQCGDDKVEDAALCYPVRRLCVFALFRHAAPWHPLLPVVSGCAGWASQARHGCTVWWSLWPGTCGFRNRRVCPSVTLCLLAFMCAPAVQELRVERRWPGVLGELPDGQPHV